jgi:hypothetical protein
MIYYTFCIHEYLSYVADTSYRADKLSYTCNVSSIHVPLVSEIRTTNLSGDEDVEQVWLHQYRPIGVSRNAISMIDKSKDMNKIVS